MQNTRPIDKLTDHDDLLEAFRTLRAEAEESLAPRWREIRRNWHFYYGKQYLDENYDPDETAPSWRTQTRIIRNICFRAVEAIRPILQRGYPKLFLHADFPDAANQFGVRDSDLVSRLQEIIEAEDERYGEGIETGKTIADCRVQGVAYRKVVYDWQKNRVSRPILPYDSVLPDPYGTKANFDDHKYVIHISEMDVADIERYYGVKEEDFGGDSIPSDSRMGLVRRLRQVFDTQSNKYQRKRYEVAELYYNEATNSAMVYDEPESKSLKFPRGRLLVVINNKLIPPRFKSMSIPFSHGEFPIVSYHAFPLAHKFMSHGDIDQLVYTQIAINVLYQQVIMNALLMSNAQWVIEDGAVPSNWITNQPGLVIKTKPGQFDKVKRLDPSPLPGDVFRLVQELEQFGQEQTRTTDVLLGQAPQAGASGVLANTLQSAAMMPHTMAMEFLDESHRREAKLRVSTMQDYVRFDDRKLVGLRDLGEWHRWDEDMRTLLFDVEVQSRSELPQNVIARLNFALQQLQVGAWDLEEYLDFTGVPVREDLRTKIRNISKMFIPGIPVGEQIALRIQAGLTGESLAGGQPMEGQSGAQMPPGLMGGGASPFMGAGIPQQAMPQI